MADQAYSPQGEQPQGGSKKKWIIAGCCGCAALAVIAVVAVIALGAFGIKAATEPAAATSREFLSRMGGGDAAGAFSTFSTQLQAEYPLENLQQNLKDVPGLFKVKDSTFNERNITAESGIAVVVLKGTLVLESGETKYCKFKAIQQPPGTNTWKLLAFNIKDTPVD
jgi:hypothetical protein